MPRFVRLILEEEIPEGPVKISFLGDKIKESIQKWLELLEKDSRSAAESLEITEYSYDAQFHTPA